jgi:hypothetical protein
LVLKVLAYISGRIEKLLILYHTPSLHVLHACVIFSVTLSMCNSLEFISCQDRYIL